MLHTVLWQARRGNLDTCSASCPAVLLCASHLGAHLAVCSMHISTCLISHLLLAGLPTLHTTHSLLLVGCEVSSARGRQPAAQRPRVS